MCSPRILPRASRARVAKSNLQMREALLRRRPCLRSSSIPAVPRWVTTPGQLQQIGSPHRSAPPWRAELASRARVAVLPTTG
eukprot:250574-Pyramimonas_sp.AAC.1